MACIVTPYDPSHTNAEGTTKSQMATDNRTCRGSWDVALCGADTSYSPVVLFVHAICPKCAEEAQRRYEALGISDVPGDVVTCFETGRPCPRGDEAEQVWQRVRTRPEKLRPT